MKKKGGHNEILEYIKASQNAMMEGNRAMIGHMNEVHRESMEKLCGALSKTKEEQPRPSKIIKSAKVPVWTKEITLETYIKQIRTWNEVNNDVPENNRFQDLVESLKLNKEIKGLAAYVNDHLLKTCEKKEDQEVERVLEILEKKYGRSRLEKIEEWMENLIGFNETNYEEDDDLLFGMEEIRKRKNELKISDEEWMVTWMLRMVKKRKGLQQFEYQVLRNVIKEKTVSEVFRGFEEKYQELKIEGNWSKIIDTHYMGSDSLSRKRYHGFRSQSRE